MGYKLKIMNNKIVTIALGAALTTFAFVANAQKKFTEGIMTYNSSSAAGETETKIIFRGDSSQQVIVSGPATIKLTTTANRSYFAVMVDVPVASIKKAAVLTPDEVDQASEESPKYTFTPTTETKQIAGYNCKKFLGKDAKTGADAEVWVTNEISVPSNLITAAFAGTGGFPVEITATQQGVKATSTLKTITEQKVPAGTFAVTKDYDKITYDELKAMRGH